MSHLQRVLKAVATAWLSCSSLIKVVLDINKRLFRSQSGNCLHVGTLELLRKVLKKSVVARATESSSLWLPQAALSASLFKWFQLSCKAKQIKSLFILETSTYFNFLGQVLTRILHKTMPFFRELFLESKRFPVYKLNKGKLNDIRKHIQLAEFKGCQILSSSSSSSLSLTWCQLPKRFQTPSMGCVSLTLR